MTAIYICRTFKNEVLEEVALREPIPVNKTYNAIYSAHISPKHKELITELRESMMMGEQVEQARAIVGKCLKQEELPKALRDLSESEIEDTMHALWVLSSHTLLLHGQHIPLIDVVLERTHLIHLVHMSINALECELA